MRRVALAVAFVALVAGAPVVESIPSAAADAAVTYQSPVDGTVTDPFRMSASPYAAGNRGIDYATAPGAPVRAAAAGQVVFAGQVGGTLHVVVLHADGIRTSYSFLASMDVVRGDRVAAGQTLGSAGASFHFGARAGDAYVDPAVLLGSGPVHVRLVPEALRQPGSEEHERRSVLGMLSSLAGAGFHATEAGVAWAAEQTVDMAVAPLHIGIDTARLLLDVDELDAWTAYARKLGDPMAWALTVAGDVWHAGTDPCTAKDVPAPRLAQRHLLVEVAGLGSHTGERQKRFEAGAVARVHAGDLGYAPEDVVQFSYGGGTTREHAYSSADTQVDMRTSARQLARLLQREAAAHPGVPIDIVAHSQGGLVARAALAYEIDLTKPGHPPVVSLVTLGTPHHGANLATAGTQLGQSIFGDAAEALAGDLQLAGIDPRSPSVRQLAETSKFIRELNERPLPAGLNFTSVAARGDPVVPSPRAHVDGASNVIVDVPGIGSDHDELPGSAGAHRELALALNGLPPTCKSVVSAVGDAVVGQTISIAERTLGAGLATAGHALSPPIPSLPK
jgi:hypothetical protein